MKSSDKKYTCYLHFDTNNTLYEEEIKEVDKIRYRIEVIKIYKRLTKIGLKECKDYVDEYLHNGSLIMKLTKEEIYQIQEIITIVNESKFYKIEFYFDGLETYRNNSIDEILK